MHIHRVLGATATLSIVWSFAAAASPAAAPTRLSVRVYDDVGLRPVVLEQVMGGAAGVFRNTGVTVAWTLCSKNAGADAGCGAPLAVGDFAVRIVTVPIPRGYRGDAPLGDSLVDTQRKAGVLATIYYDRIEWLARAAGTDPTSLLAHAIAHEIRHLAEGTTHHDTTGLMRPRWTADELRRDRATDWQIRTD